MGALSTWHPKLWLIGASLFFYGWSEPRYVLLLVCSVLLNFSVGAVLNGYRPRQPTKRKIVLILGIAANIALLGYYKYADFVIMNRKLSVSRTDSRCVHWFCLWASVSLPLSRSAISLIVTVIRSKGYDLLTYGLFGTFFPYILAGPIVHHAEIIPQLKKVAKQAVNYRNLSLGLYLLSIGLFKKVVVADRLGEWASEGFAAAAPLNFLYAWVTSLCYTFQIYFDFSGYTDMALGSALMFNIRLPINFNSPYKALDIQDFWRRWHITLGRFLAGIHIHPPWGKPRPGKSDLSQPHGHVYHMRDLAWSRMDVRLLGLSAWRGPGAPSRVEKDGRATSCVSLPGFLPLFSSIWHGYSFAPVHGMRRSRCSQRCAG